MKKKRGSNGFMPFLYLNLKRMKLTLALVTLTVFSSFAADLYSQNTKLSLEYKNEKIVNILRAIEDQSEFRFFYNEEIDLNVLVSIEKSNAPIGEVLDKVFENSSITYEIIGRQIILKTTKAVSSSSLQQRTISGRVTDTSGTPMPGVTVVVKGTSTGTITDSEGKYQLSNIPDNAVFLFSFVGMSTQELAVAGKATLDVIMRESEIGLDEVVVVGYGTQKKKDLTGSISRVSGEDLGQVSTLSFDQMLQGKVAGVQISQTSGAPGGNVNVLIRGVSSITGGNQPLYVIDGFPIGAGGGVSNMMSFAPNTYSSTGMTENIQNRINPLASINPADIESIDILKDASATAIYGSRGANGVIIITTKRGAAGKVQINVDVSYGVQEVAHKLDMMNARQYAEFVAEGRDNARVYSGGLASDPNEIRSSREWVKPEFRNPESIITDTDWQDVIFRIAPVQNYQVSAMGSTDKTKYFLSAGYFDQEGIILTSNYKRFNIRSNIDTQITDRLKIGSSISGSYGYGRFPNTEGHYGYGGILSMALSASPTIPVYDDEGNYYFNEEDVIYGLGWLANPLSVLDGYSDNRKVADVIMNNYAEYEIIEGLALRSSFGVKYGTNVIKLWRSSAVPYNTTLNYPATAGVIKAESLNWLNENTLTYKHTFKEKHVFDALLGFTAQKDSYDLMSAGAADFPTDYVSYISAGIVNSGNHSVSEWSILSLISRINYAYDGKYLLTATVRRDGSSRFGKNHKWGTFPSFSVGYNISEEPFMNSVKFIDHLKIRASYGFSGNNQIGNYSQIGLLSTSNYVEDNNQKPGLVPSSLSNDDLTWEKSKQINLGFDLNLFNGRISLTTDLYKDHKTDLLLDVELPAASGFSSSTQNIGDIENKGIEIGLNTVNVKRNRFEWATNFTFSANKNKVLEVATEGGRITNSDYQITQAGYPISSFYLMHVLGVFRNSEELAGAPIQHPKTQEGDLRYEDVTLDGKITGDDKKIMGDPWPDYTWGLDNRFTFGNLTLSVSLNGSRGGHSYLLIGETLLNSAGVQNQLVLSDRRWRSEDDPGDGLIPRAIRNNYAYGYRSSSRFLFDSSFTRIKNVNVTYSFPRAVTSRLSLTNLSVYTDVANLHTFTDYPGYDPESSTAGDDIVNTGIDYLTYPLPRIYTVGIKLTF